MLAIDDLLSDLDVLAVDSTALTAFSVSPTEALINLAAKRRLAVDTWLRGRLEEMGMPPSRHRVRRVPDQVLAYRGGAYVDFTEAASDTTETGLALGSIIASTTQDALYVRSLEPFKAVWVGMLGTVNAAAGCVSSWTYWNGGQWAGFNSLVDATRITGSVAFSGGGRVSWQMPGDWERRPVGTADPVWGYWARCQTATVPTSAAAITHLLTVRPSRFTVPCALQTLALIYGESWGAQSGEWREKAEAYAGMAGEALSRAVTAAIGEFVDDDEAEAVTPTMVNSVSAMYDPRLFTLDRG